MPPAWLPALQPYNGNWDEYLELIHPVFKKDFVDAQPDYCGKPVRIIRDPTLNGKEHSFWHVTSEGPDENTRTPDFRRCERIGWIRALIDNASDPSVKCWVEVRKGKSRAHIWLEDQGFLVVLEERTKCFYLVTAYPTEGDHQREKYRNRFKKANTVP